MRVKCLRCGWEGDESELYYSEGDCPGLEEECDGLDEFLEFYEETEGDEANETTN